MAHVFFSYSHADEALRNELEKHLAGLRREAPITRGAATAKTASHASAGRSAWRRAARWANQIRASTPSMIAPPSTRVRFHDINE